jgi:hypothetical protein
MCSNAGRIGPPAHPGADLAARLAAAIDELAAAARSPVSSGKDGIEAHRVGQDPADRDPADRDPADRDPADRDRADREPAYQSPAEDDLAERLARAWAMITAADPEVAARTARYAHP